MTSLGEVYSVIEEASGQIHQSANALVETRQLADDAHALLAGVSGDDHELGNAATKFEVVCHGITSLLSQIEGFYNTINPCLAQNGLQELQGIDPPGYTPGAINVLPDDVRQVTCDDRAKTKAALEVTKKSVDDSGSHESNEPDNKNEDKPLPSKIKILDGKNETQTTLINRIGIQGGELIINHGVPAYSDQVLAPIEEAVLVLTSLGLNSSETAQTLDITEGKAQAYRASLLQKVQGEEGNISQATVTAFNKGILNIATPIAAPSDLNDTDRQIMTRIGRGETYEEIADHTGIKSHNLRKKVTIRARQVGMRNRVGLLTYDIMSGQVKPQNVALPLPSHITVLESNYLDGSVSQQFTKAAYKDGIVSFDPDAKVPFGKDRSGKPLLTAAQGNTLLLSVLGLANTDIAEIASNSGSTITSLRAICAEKINGSGCTIGKLTVEAIRNGNILVEKHIDTNMVPLTATALEIVSDAGKGLTLEQTSSRLGWSINKLRSHLISNVYSRIDTRGQESISSLLLYSILTKQYDPHTGKIKLLH